MADAVRLRDLGDRFIGRAIIVVGDLICDEYLIGKIGRAHV